MTSQETIRHFTVTGFLVAEDSLALHWHVKVGAWLPPGGHVEPNEDPVQAVLREISEETGLSASVVPVRAPLAFDYPPQIDAPLTVLIEDVVDQTYGAHQHIDFVYVCRSAAGQAALPKGWMWVASADVAAGQGFSAPGRGVVAPPEDVRELARIAFGFPSA